MRKLIPFILFIFGASAHAVDTTNLLTNPGFEFGKTKWTASGGTFNLTSTAADIASGNRAASWDSNGAAQTFSHDVIAIPPGLYGRNGLASCSYKVSSGTGTHKLQVFDGTNVLAEQTITSATQYRKAQVNFVYPGSGNITLRTISVAADEPALLVDDCALQDALNVSNVSQAQFVGSATWAITPSCRWTVGSATMGDFGADGDCPAPTVTGEIAAGSSGGKPEFTVNNASPGKYIITATMEGQTDSAGTTVALRLSDGTNSSGRLGFVDVGAQPLPISLIGNFEYTVSGNRTFKVQASVSSSTFGIENSNTAKGQVVFHAWRFPLSSEQAFRPDVVAQSWSGYHDTDCSWTTTSATYVTPSADGSCTFTELTNTNFGTVTSSGAKTPGIVFTPARAGKYEVCVNMTARHGSLGQDLGAALVQNAIILSEKKVQAAAPPDLAGLDLCGQFRVTSVASTTVSIQIRTNSGTMTLDSNNLGRAINWNIKQIDQALPAPLLVGSVTSSSTGLLRADAAAFTCSGSSSISSQTGSAFSSVGNISTGACALTLSGFSAAPFCSVTRLTDADPSQVFSVNSLSSTNVTVDCETVGGADCTSYSAHILCMGPR